MDDEIYLMSAEGPVRNDQPQPVDITETFTVFQVNVVLMYFSAVILMYYLAKTIRYCSTKRTRRIMTLRVWPLLCILLQQAYSTPKHYLIKHFVMMLIFATVILVGYYKNLFATDLVSVEQGYLIDTIEDLIESDTIPCSSSTANQLEYFKDHRNPIYRSVYSRYIRSLPNSHHSNEMKNLPKLINSILSRQCTFTSTRIRIKPYMMYYCNSLERYQKPKIHVAEQVYGRSLVTMIVNRNIADILHDRFNKAHQMAIENGVLHLKLLEDFVQNYAKAMGGLVSHSVQICVSGEYEHEQIVVPLQLVNTRYLYLTVSVSFSVALIILILEHVTRFEAAFLLIRHCRKSTRKRNVHRRSRSR